MRAGTLRSTRTGVFVGAIWDDYATLHHRSGLTAISPHTVTGLHRSIIANRVSYFLGLNGPSLTVDSGQSSSLVSVHLACESLRKGESTIALAGGVNLNIVPESTLGAAKFGGLSPDGRCFTFDARANGYVRGEGGGIVVLKPLARAVADGDPVHCVIRGSAVNNDGGGDGLTVPLQSGQEQVLRLAYERAGVDPAHVGYVELHGTGTKVGDPVEAAALGAVLGAGRDSGRPLRVGSAKTNVGHLEGAAGITGLLKAVLSLNHRELPASLNFETPNPAIPLDRLNLRVQTEHSEWATEDGRPLLAGVSSFGMGGTNCHIVLSEHRAPATGVAAQAGTGAAPTLWPLSAKTAPGLRAQAAALLAHAEAHPGLALPDAGWSLAHRVPTPGRRRGRGPRRLPARPARAVHRRHRRRADHGPHGPARRARLPLLGPGQPATRHGPRTGRCLPGVRHRAGRGVRTPRPPVGAAAARGHVRPRRLRGGGRTRPDPLHADLAVRRRGRPVPAPGELAHHPRRADGPLHRRTRRRARGRRPLARRRLRPRGRARPPDAGAARRRRHDRRPGRGGRGPSPRRRPHGPREHRRAERPGLRRRLRRRGPRHRDRRRLRRPGPQDQPAAGQPRLPLPAHGTHAGGVPRRGRGPDLPRPAHPDRVQRDGPAVRGALGVRRVHGRVLGPPRARGGPLRRRRRPPRRAGRPHVPGARPRRRAHVHGPCRC